MLFLSMPEFVIDIRWPLVSLGFNSLRALQIFKSACLSVKFVERAIIEGKLGWINF